MGFPGSWFLPAISISFRSRSDLMLRIESTPLKAVDLPLGDGLPVCDHGERLKHRPRQADILLADEPSHPVLVIRLRPHLKACGNLHDLYGPLRRGIRLGEAAKGGLDLQGGEFRKTLLQLLECYRL